MTLAHYTLNNGDHRSSPLCEVNEATINYLDPLISNCGGRVPAGNGKDEMGFALIPAGEWILIKICLRTQGRFESDPPFIVASLAWSENAAEAAWITMRRIGKRWGMRTESKMPSDLPLLTVLLTPFAVLVAPRVLAAVADLERCIAWTVLTQEGLT